MLDLGKEFNKHPLNTINIKRIQSNIIPIVHMILILELGKIVTSGDSYESGPILKIWNYSSNILEKVITLESKVTHYIKTLCYVQKYFFLIIGYDYGEFQILNLENEIIIITKKVSDIPICLINYIHEDYHFMTIERNSKLLVNYIYMFFYCYVPLAI